ncbi:tRNA 2-selenouridine synthase [Sphaerotilus hippei]|uniref:tRNA 2-selenouridine synthase n=1 Tax=Sphaerotilus hippei TaxID=744406 RepID=A0A318H6E0_9BURK|nr:tRNA 2-selenouridine(34) synthase MnmH [Sphaerotilus hippei]PXW99570.1 tRNA 2-selenouridine synthase [Sphaerotilus hippei]
MAPPRPVTVADLGRFQTVIDARSPAEFALDHLPGAINCPVLDDEERRIVGTLYKQQGAFEARRVGGAMVAQNLARHLRECFAEQPASWKPLVYCWRGGMRSGSMVTWLRLVGWDARQLQGGYKAFRHQVITEIDRIAPTLDLRVICGPTGSAKTRVLQALEATGRQVLDLEGCASHKGSVLGGLPGVQQPSQKRFETRLHEALRRLDPTRPVYIEAESRKIGQLALPTRLLEPLRAAPCIEIEASPEARLRYLLHDYAYLGDDGEHLAQKVGHLKDMHSRETIERWQAWARTGELEPLFDELMRSHYDPHYQRSQQTHLTRWAQAQRVVAAELDPAGIAGLAEAIGALPAPPPAPVSGPAKARAASLLDEAGQG